MYGPLFIQLILLINCFLLVQRFTNRELMFQYEIWLAFLVGWLISVWLTHKHKPKFYQKRVKYILAPYPKAFIINVLIVSIGALFFELVRTNLTILLISIGIYALIEYFIMYLLVLYKVSGKFKAPAYSSPAKYMQKDLDLSKYPSTKYIPADIFLRQLDSRNREILSSLYQKTFDSQSRQSQKGDLNDLVVGDIDQISRTDKKRLSLVVLNTKVNDLKKINAAFKKCYDRLIPGGYFVICYNNIDGIEDKLKKSFPAWPYYLILPFHRLFCSVLSKIPKLDEFQEWLSHRHNRAISWIEVSGRLAYCGFDVQVEERHQDIQYVISRKTKIPSDNPRPSYHPIIALDRVGLYGHVIKIHKFRTMYPYSEFLQKKVFEENSLSTTGKFNTDYRITTMGKILRKYWVDELPQLIDWLRGEIKLVGIRAMSIHFFSLYPKEYQELFVKVKPGILSPIFDESTGNFNQIVETESKYLQSYLKHPILTDVSYFFMTIHQIIFRGIRSR